MESPLIAPEFIYVGLGLFLGGIVFTLLAVKLMLKRRMLMAGLNGTLGFSLLSIATVSSLILLNLHTYYQLTSEIELAQIEIGTPSSSGVPVKLRVDDVERVFMINAAEWQLDARFLKWKPWAYLLGSEPLVRLETLSGRKTSPSPGVSEAHYRLLNENPMSDWGAKISHWTGMVDTYYGSSVYMPAVEGSVYSVSASVSGLLARAENNIAKQAMSRWTVQ